MNTRLPNGNKLYATRSARPCFGARTQALLGIPLDQTKCISPTIPLGASSVIADCIFSLHILSTPSSTSLEQTLMRSMMLILSVSVGNTQNLCTLKRPVLGYQDAKRSQKYLMNLTHSLTPLKTRMSSAYKNGGSPFWNAGSVVVHISQDACNFAGIHDWVYWVYTRQE